MFGIGMPELLLILALGRHGLEAEREPDRVPAGGDGDRIGVERPAVPPHNPHPLAAGLWPASRVDG